MRLTDICDALYAHALKHERAYEQILGNTYVIPSQLAVLSSEDQEECIDNIRTRLLAARH